MWYVSALFIGVHVYIKAPKYYSSEYKEKGGMLQYMRVSVSVCVSVCLCVSLCFCLCVSGNTVCVCMPITSAHGYKLSGRVAHAYNA